MRGLTVAEPQLSVRSARARELAHELARRERRTVAEVVQRALEEYAAHHADRVPAATFYRQLNEACAVDLELEAVIREERRPNEGSDL